MKRKFRYGGLLVIYLLFLASCGSLSLNVKHHAPPIEQSQNEKAIVPTAQVISTTKSNPFTRLLENAKRKIYALLGLLWLWLLARFYGGEKRRRVRGWQLEDLALLKIIKDNAARLWNHHHPSKKIISLDNWRN